MPRAKMGTVVFRKIPKRLWNGMMVCLPFEELVNEALDNVLSEIEQAQTVEEKRAALLTFRDGVIERQKNIYFDDVQAAAKARHDTAQRIAKREANKPRPHDKAVKAAYGMWFDWEHNDKSKYQRSGKTHKTALIEYILDAQSGLENGLTNAEHLSALIRRWEEGENPHLKQEHYQAIISKPYDDGSVPITEDELIEKMGLQGVASKTTTKKTTKK